MSDLVLEARLRAKDEGLAGQLNAAELRANSLTSTLNNTSTAATQLSSTSGQAAAAQETVARASGRAAASLSGEAASMNASTAAANQKQAALQSLNSQQSAVNEQVSAGAEALGSFATEGIDASSVMEALGGSTDGTAGKVGLFAGILSGGLGLAIGFVTGLITEFVDELFASAEATAAAEAGTDGLAAAQSALGEIFDLVSGKLKKQNELLIINARLQAINLRKEAADARESSMEGLENAKDAPLGSFGLAGRRVLGIYQGFKYGVDYEAGIARSQGKRRAIADLATGVDQGGIDAAEAVRLAGNMDFTDTGVDKNEFLAALRDKVVAKLKDEVATEIEKSLDTGNLSSMFREEGPQGRKPRGSRGGGGSGSGEFGESAAEKIQRISDAYNPAPRGLDKAFADLRTLDGLIEDLGKRKPPSFETLIAEAQEARAAVLEGIADPIDDIQQRLIPLPEGVAKAQAAIEELDGVIAVLTERKPPNWEELVARAQELKQVAADTAEGPLTDMLRASREQRDVQLLVLQGREREAAVLEIVQQKTREMGELNGAQVKSIEGMVAAEERINDLLTKRQDIISIYMAGIGDLRGALEDLFSGDGGNFLKSTERLFKQMQARLTVESLFGDSLRALEKKVRGQTPLDREIDELAKQVGGLEGETDRSSKALKLFGDTVAQVTAQIKQSVVQPAHVLNGPDQFRTFGDDIVVTGKPAARTAAQQAIDAQTEYARAITVPITEKLDEMLGANFFRKLEPVFSGALGGFWTAGPVGGVLGALKEFPGLPDKLKATFGTALEGAQTGVMVAGIGKMLGIKTSSTGGAIGGAIGSALPIPGGEIIGSIIGSVIGGMFKKAKTGSATITGVDSDPTITGNSSKMRDAASSAAGSVQDLLSRIADELGGEVGSFSVSIGLRDGKYRVDPTGRGNTKTKKGAIDFGEDGTAAALAAALDAISDGGIIGVSEAVQRALRSSKDIDKALREALKVQEVEEILSGLGGTIERQFREFETQAKERVRIATQYGFDVTKIEARNAEDRAKLVEKILAERVGSLQDLLEDFKFGDLFEGSATERRDKLLAEIALAKADADKGVDGAADRVADLTRRLVETSRDAFGTAGPEYGADRANAISTAEAIIAAENERIRAAQQATIDTSKALATNNQLTNETNDILAEMRAMMRANAAGEGSAFLQSMFGTARSVTL